MRSLLDHVASRHDGDDVRVLDGGQAVGDDDAGAALSGFVQRVLDRLADGEKKQTNVSVAHAQAGATGGPHNYRNLVVRA